MLMSRYGRNIGAITEDEQALLLTKTVLVVGAGGLGGYSVEMLSRIGVGAIKICDFDVFEETNLNRQLYATEETLGESKAVVAKRKINAINSAINVTVYNERFSKENANEMLDGVDVIIDALDNVNGRLLLEKVASEHNIPLIFGAVSGWIGQVCTILPNKPVIEKLFKNVPETINPVLPFATATIAACQVSQAVKVLIDRHPLLDGKLLLIDLENSDIKFVTI